MPAEVSRNATTYKDKHPALDALGLDIIKLDNRKLGGAQRENDLDNAKFNGCIFSHNGQRMMCYRAYSERLRGSSNIFITEFDEHYHVKRNIELDLPSYGVAQRQYEDARLFEHKGELYCSYVVVAYGTKYWCAIHVVKLDENYRVVRHFVPHYGGNGATAAQKNWIFFSENDTLYCIYNPRRHKVLTLDDNFNVKNITQDKPILWPYGPPRGGTTPIYLGHGTWVAFFHAALKHNQRKRRYSMTPYVFTKEKVLSVGKTIFASMENPIVDASATWWHPIVVFPMGMIKDGDDFIVSVGVNDILTWLVRFPRSWVFDQTDVEEFHSFTPRYFFWDNATGFAHLSDYTVLKVGSKRTMVKGRIMNAEDFGYTVENYPGLEFLSEYDYNCL